MTNFPKGPRLAAVVVCATLSLTVSSAALAQVHVRADAAMTALRHNDCPGTLASLRQGMLDNEPASFFISAHLAETGTCAQVDPTAAAAAYERAAFLGNPDAAAPLALLHAEGAGVPQSYPQAARWYAIAALGGSPSAAANASGFDDAATVARTYVHAVHDFAYFELANRLKYPYPLGARVRFDPVTGSATITGRTAGAGPRDIADGDILASYAEAVRELPKPPLPASPSFATERAMGAANNAN